MKNQRGQALVEFSVFVLIFCILIVGIFAFTRWMATRQKLLLASKEAALLYSSGRFTPKEVNELVRSYLKTGSPPIDPDGVRIAMGPETGVWGSYWVLDRIVIHYRPTKGWYWLLNFNQEMEEVCIVRHAPSYLYPHQPFLGPRVERKSAVF